ncbi:MAG: type II toxin-antitoxin system RelE/ParE family toxin [Chitinophagales bacterium]|nr:type II toxin-antitoxin system RelE/ParE family toxin [Chitinophagales bacterium]
MSYKILFKRSAKKELEDLPASHGKKVYEAIVNLKFDPRPHGCKKLKGTDDTCYRIRIGDYRVLYVIEDAVKIVEIIKVSHRRDVYE